MLSITSDTATVCLLHCLQSYSESQLNNIIKVNPQMIIDIFYIIMGSIFQNFKFKIHKEKKKEQGIFPPLLFVVIQRMLNKDLELILDYHIQVRAVQTLFYQMHIVSF